MNNSEISVPVCDFAFLSAVQSHGERLPAVHGLHWGRWNCLLLAVGYRFHEIQVREWFAD